MGRVFQWFVADLSRIRIVYWVIVVVLGIWVVAETRSRPAVPTAAQPLDVNHEIKPGDLQTPEIAALTNRYLRLRVEAGKPVTSDMVGDQPGMPVIDSGFIVVLNMSRSLCEHRNIRDGDSVQISSGNQPLGGPGVVRSITCDEHRCAVAVGFGKAPDFNPQALQGADLNHFLPPPPARP